MSKIIPLGGKRLVQTLISDVAKKMRMSSNFAKRKREEKEPAHWEGELYSNSSNFVVWNQFGKGEVASFCQLPVSPVYHGQNTVSKIGDMSKINESCLEDISGPAKIFKNITYGGGIEFFDQYG